MSAAIPVNIEVKELKEGAVTKVVAQIKYDRGGREWMSTVSGQGASRADAVADLVSRKFKTAFAPMLLSKLEEMLPKAQSPKVPESADTSEAPDKDKSSERDKKDTPKAPKDQTDTPPQTSAPEAAREPEKVDQKKKPTGNSEKPAGTKQESKSEAKSDDKDAF